MKNYNIINLHSPENEIICNYLCKYTYESRSILAYRYLKLPKSYSPNLTGVMNFMNQLHIPKNSFYNKLGEGFVTHSYQLINGIYVMRKSTDSDEVFNQVINDMNNPIYNYRFLNKSSYLFNFTELTGLTYIDIPKDGELLADPNSKSVIRVDNIQYILLTSTDSSDDITNPHSARKLAKLIIDRMDLSRLYGYKLSEIPKSESSIKLHKVTVVNNFYIDKYKQYYVTNKTAPNFTPDEYYLSKCGIKWSNPREKEILKYFPTELDRNKLEYHQLIEDPVKLNNYLTENEEVNISLTDSYTQVDEVLNKEYIITGIKIPKYIYNKLHFNTEMELVEYVSDIYPKFLVVK